MTVPSRIVDGGLSQEQIALVLWRAAELDKELACAPGTALDVNALEQAAVEAGISTQSVRRALAELQAGMLERAPQRPLSRWLGPGTLTLCRTVVGPPSSVEEQLHRFLRRELFELRRDFGDRTSWTARRGLDARVRRSVDRGISRRLILRDVQHVDLSVVEEPGSAGRRVLVRLDVDVKAMRQTQGLVAGSAAAMGAGVVTISAAAAGLDPVLLLTTAAGAGVAGAGHRIGARVYRNRVGEIESALDGVLDRLERPASRRLA